MEKIQKATIIIPCHNVPEEYIIRAIASVRLQTFPDYEVIVVDDGSEVPYAAVLEWICDDKEKTKLIRIPKSGVSAARNAGIKIANGDYIAFLDADDVLADDFLERALAVAEETEADFIIGGLEEAEETAVPYCPPRTGKPQTELFVGEDLCQTVGRFLIGLRSQITFPGGYIGRGPVSRLIRREIVQGILFDPALTIGEDLVWNLEILKQCRKVCLVKESWYSYWQNPLSVIHRRQPELIDEYRKQIEKVTDLIDITDNGMYASYADQIYEGLRLFWFRYLSSERQKNPENYRKAVHGVYTEWPWTEIGTDRYFRQVGGKKRITAVLYRLRLFYPFLAWKERISPSEICVSWE